MIELKQLGITMGRAIEKSAPIKEAHIVEGYSDIELETEVDELKKNLEKEDLKVEYVGPVIP
jgi:hypothetical protein